MRKIMFFVCIVFAMFLFVSCMTAPENDNMQNNGRVVGFVHGIITDGNTGAVLSGVEVVYNLKGSTKIVKSDKNGYYAIKDLHPGTYTITYKGSGLATYYATHMVPTLAMIGIDDIPTGENFNHSMTLDRTMYQTKSAFAGHVYVFRNNNTEQIAANNVKVIATMPTGYLPRQYETTTNAQGKYEFTNMPSINGQITFKTEGTIRLDNHLFSSNEEWPMTPIYNERVEVPFISMTIQNVAVELLQQTVTTYAPGQSLVFRFSHSISNPTVTTSIPNVNPQNYTTQWTNNNTTLNINFINNYQLSPLTTYYFSITGLAAENSDIGGRSFYNFTWSDGFTTPNFP